MMKSTSVCFIAVFLALAGTAVAQRNDPRIGTRVFMVHGTLLKTRGKVVNSRGRVTNLATPEQSQNTVRVYRVERARGEWLWLQDEKGRVAGWAQSRYVIPYDQALEHFTRLINTKPRADDFCCRGNVWEERGEFDKAIADYSEAIRRDPRVAVYWNNRGHSWQDKQDPDKAIADFTRAIELDPKFVYAYRDRGYAWHLKQDFDKAVADYTRAIQLDPRNAWAYLGRGAARAAKKDYDKAVADYDRAIRLDPKDGEAYLGRGGVWEEQQHYDKALADFTRAIELAPKDARGYQRRGRAWSFKKEHDKSIDDFNKCIEINPKDGWAYHSRGVAWEEKHQYARALADFTRAIEVAPEQPDGYNGRAWLQATCPDAKYRDGAKAVAAATTACELAHWKEPAVLDTMAAACAEAGDFESAVKWQSKGIELLSDETARADLRTRLELYRAKKPYRHK